MKDIPTITNDQLRDLFAKHCACRPLDFHRTEDDHASIHDCDTAILCDVQTALGIIRFDDTGRIQAAREARARCAEICKKDRIGATNGWKCKKETAK